MKQLLMFVPLAVLALAAAAEAQSLSMAADVSAASHDALVGLCHGTHSATHPFAFIIVHAKAVPVHLDHGDVIASDPADCKLSFHYVTDSLRIGSTPREAHANAVDLNNDGFPDNALGSTLAVLSRPLGFDEQIATSLEMGEVVILHSLRADSLIKDDVASWQVFLGEPQPHPVLSGGGTFAIDPAAPDSEKLIGPITKGQFVGGPGVALRLGLVAGQPPVEIHLVEARIQTDCDADSCSGTLGGGVTQTEVDTVIIPAMAAGMQMVVDADPLCAPSSPGPCTGVAGSILALFDANGDHVVTADELRENALIQALLTPDLDLLDANGNPGQDGIQESLSLGLGFTSKHAIFEEL